MLTFSKLGRLGRFGNQLFQISGIIGLAVKHGYAYGFPRWQNYDHSERFGSTEDIDIQKYFLHPLPVVERDFPDRYIDWGYHPHLHLPDNISISGHFQSEKYFSHCREIIDYYFTMKDEPPQNERIAIHWRLGDYDDNYHTRLKLEYYEAALRLFPSIYKAIIFSDDNDSAEKMAMQLSHLTGVDTYVQKGGNYITDFRLMKTCKHFICGNSSYSLMAAILGRHPEKKIVCPKAWFGPAWNPPLETKDIYPENAIIL